MTIRNLALPFYLAIFFLGGCASLTSTTEQTAKGIDGIPCVGTIKPPPAGVEISQDKSLLKETLAATDDGKLCQGKVFVVTQPVTVYRVWNSNKDYTRFGGWWSFSQPKGPRQKYREDNVICPSWSALDRMSSCTIKIGTRVVVGTGQSAKCKTGIYAKSAANQVYIPNDGRKNILYVENCTAGVEWP